MHTVPIWFFLFDTRTLLEHVYETFYLSIAELLQMPFLRLTERKLNR